MGFIAKALGAGIGASVGAVLGFSVGSVVLLTGAAVPATWDVLLSAIGFMAGLYISLKEDLEK